MHPTEGMWQELLDGESDPLVQRDLTIHAEICPDCQSLVDQLSERRALVTGLLDRLDRRVPRLTLAEVLDRPGKQVRTSRRSLAAAAVIAVCVATAAGASVRLGLVDRAVEWLLGPAPKQQSEQPIPALQPRAGASTGIALTAGKTLEVALDQWPAAGELEILLRPAPEVSVMSSVPAVYSVRRGRIAISNEGRSGSFRIVLPQTLPAASIRVNNQVVFSKQGAAIHTRARRTGPASYLLPFPQPEFSK